MKIKVIIVFFISTFLFSQQGKIVQQKNKLSDLRNEIQRLENELNNLKQNEKSSIRVLNKVNQQILAYDKVIVHLRTQEKQKELKILEIQDSINTILTNIDNLKNEYAKYVKWLYMFGRREQLNYLVTSKSVSQAFTRYKYFNYITNKNKRTLNLLEQNKNLKILLASNYTKELNEKNRLIKVKEYEQKTLQAKKNEKESLLTQLRKDKKNIFDEIDSKQKAEIRIKDLIARLEKEDIERRKQILESEVKNKVSTVAKDYKVPSVGNFGELLGKLPWPVKSGRIVRDFGENTNEQLNTVTLNYGIDIKTSTDEVVRCVADGVVSAIEWIPGYGSVIIITHSGNYRSVYGHVTDLQTEDGSRIKSGEIIGKVNDSLEGAILHFEIWDKRVYQNPSMWLARR